MEYSKSQNLAEYNAWLNMRKRCSYKKDRSFPLYSSRGITVCRRWLGKNGFRNFLSDMGPKPKSVHKREWSLDRIDNNKGYSPENCRWATAGKQARNRTSNLIVHLWGDKYCVREACKILKVNDHNFYRYNSAHKEQGVDDNFADYLTLLKRKEKSYV